MIVNPKAKGIEMNDCGDAVQPYGGHPSSSCFLRGLCNRTHDSALKPAIPYVQG